MKRTIKLILSFFLGLMLFAIYLPTASAMTTDQQCNLAPTDYDLISSATTPREQSFTPTQNRLEWVHIMVDGPGFSGDQGVTLSVLDSTRASIGSVTFSPTFPSGPDFRTAEFEPALEITPGQTYFIQVDVLDGPNNLLWYRSPGDCYAGGTAYGEGFPFPWDFLFQTLGSTYTPPVTQQVPASTATTTPSTSSSSSSSIAMGSTPATTTDSSIKPATNLIIENGSDTANPSVKLSWTKSTTSDLTGYKIFRSLEEKNNFQEIGSVPLDKNEYTDSTANAGTTYYYFVRAYKGTAQSASTPTVNATTLAASTTGAISRNDDELATTAASAETAVPKVQGPNWIWIGASILFMLLMALLTFLEMHTKKKGEKVPAKIFWPIVAGAIIVLGVLIWQLLLLQ